MAGVLQWIKATSARLADPDREERINQYAALVEREISRQRAAFDFHSTAAALQIPPGDVKGVAERAYESATERAWRDGSVSESERKALHWVSRVLDLTGEQVRTIRGHIGRACFERALAEAIADGHLSGAETARLEQIAASMETSVRELMLTYFSSEGEAFLRGLFAGIVQGGRILEEDWQRLLRASHSLGLTQDELLVAISSQAERFIEHVLAEAKADQRLSQEESGTLRAMLQRFHLSAFFRSYVVGEIATLESFTDIAKGRLPSVNAPATALRAGELAHFYGPVTYRQVRNLKSGPRVDTYQGLCTLTDYRLVFASDLKSFDCNYRKVVSLIRLREGVRLRMSGTGAGDYHFGEQARLASAIFESAVAKANQTLIETLDGLPTRHIPRDIRQRVWAKYGGRCAECGATDYLEFDHIVPHSRGGSNSEANVQLLCRRCNLTKADLI